MEVKINAQGHVEIELDTVGQQTELERFRAAELTQLQAAITVKRLPAEMDAAEAAGDAVAANAAEEAWDAARAAAWKAAREVDAAWDAYAEAQDAAWEAEGEK